MNSEEEARIVDKVTRKLNLDLAFQQQIVDKVTRKLNLDLAFQQQIVDEVTRELNLDLAFQQQIKGERGISGLDGQKGDEGALGFPGFPGLPGLDGQKGDEGSAGLRGEKGTPGTPGLRGSTGLQGPKGAEGTPGLKGDKGSAGLQGLRGERGERGAKGAPGRKGFQGMPGRKGDPGMDAVDVLSVLEELENLNVVDVSRFLKGIDEARVEARELEKRFDNILKDVTTLAGYASQSKQNAEGFYDKTKNMFCEIKPTDQSCGESRRKREIKNSNDQLLTSGASKPSSWIGSIVNWIKGSTESPALLTSREHDNTTVTAVPEINATLVNNTIILGIFTTGLFNKTQHKQPIHENLLSPREQSMRLNNIDEDMIRAMQESEELGDPNTGMGEVKVSGLVDKIGRKRGGK